MQKNLNWAVLGTGIIANEMAQALQTMGKKLFAVGNRTYAKAIDFAKKYQVNKVYKDFYQMFRDPDVDVIYITTPHNTHIEFVRQALQNGKHVLCEKSITLNTRELEEALYLAKKNHVIFAEAMTIWHMPLYKRLWNVVNIENAEEAYTVEEKFSLGKVQLIQINFGSYKEYDMENRFFNKNLAGGALLDIGVYAISLARSFMDSQPEQILSQVKYAPTGVDEKVGLLLMNSDSQMASITLSLHSKQPKRAVISCEKGYIEITEFPRADQAIIVEAETGKMHKINAGDTEMALQYEIEDMEKAILSRNHKPMRLRDTIDVMKIMTNLRKEWGMKYPGEEW